MSIAFSCTSCGKSFRVPADMAGKKGKCPQCQTVFRIPVEGKAAQKKRAKSGQADAFAFDAPGAALEGFSSEMADAGFATGGNGGGSSRPAGATRKSSGKMMLLVYLFVFLVLAGSVGAAIFYHKQLIQPPGINSDLVFMPEDARLLVSLNVSNTLASPVYQRLKDEAGIDPATQVYQTVEVLDPQDVHRITVGLAPAEPLPHAIVVIRAKKPLSAGEVTSYMKKKAAAAGQQLELKDEAIGKHTMYILGEAAMCLPHELTLVLGSPDALRAVLERNGRPHLSPAMNSALKLIDFDKAAFALAVEPAPIAQAAQKLAPLASAVAPEGAVPALPEGIDSVEAFVLEIDLTDPFALKSIALCKDGATAKDFAEKTNGLLAVGKNVLGGNEQLKALTALVDGIKASAKGPKLSISFSGKIDHAVAIGKELTKQPWSAMKPPPGGENKE